MMRGSVDVSEHTMAFVIEVKRRKDGLSRIELTTFGEFEDAPGGGSLTVGYLTDEERIRLASALLHGLNQDGPKWEAIAERSLLRRIKRSMATT